MSGLVPMDDYRRLALRCERLEEEVAALRAQVRADVNEIPMEALRGLGFRRREAEIVLELLTRAPLSVSRYSINRDCDYDHLASVYASKIRAKLKALGAPPDPIRNVWGVGYAMTSECAAWMRGQMANQQRRAA